MRNVYSTQKIESAEITAEIRTLSTCFLIISKGKINQEIQVINLLTIF